MAGASKRTFRCLKGFSYGPNGRHAFEPGDTVTHLPAEYVGWMLDQGVIEEAAKDPKGSAPAGQNSATEDS